MPTSPDTSLKRGVVCALATREEIRTSDRIFRITMNVQIIEQRKLINHAGQKAFNHSDTEEHRGNRIRVLPLCSAVFSLEKNAFHVEYRFSWLDRDPGRESHENVCALFIWRPVVPGPAWFRSGSLCWRRHPEGCVEARHWSTVGACRWGQARSAAGNDRRWLLAGGAGWRLRLRNFFAHLSRRFRALAYQGRSAQISDSLGEPVCDVSKGRGRRQCRSSADVSASRRRRTQFVEVGLSGRSRRLLLALSEVLV